MIWESTSALESDWAWTVAQHGADASVDYKAGGALQFYFEFAKRFALVRPAVPPMPRW